MVPGLKTVSGLFAAAADGNKAVSNDLRRPASGAVLEQGRDKQIKTPARIRGADVYIYCPIFRGHLNQEAASA
jgi:hypothetical protein